MGRQVLFLLALAVLTVMPVAQAEEGKPPLAAALRLNLFHVPMDSPETVFRESLKVATPPRPTLEWEILPDGSARYGTVRVGVIVSPPCQAGAPRPVALPGRVPR